MGNPPTVFLTLSVFFVSQLTKLSRIPASGDHTISPPNGNTHIAQRMFHIKTDTKLRGVLQAAKKCSWELGVGTFISTPTVPSGCWWGQSFEQNRRWGAPWAPGVSWVGMVAWLLITARWIAAHGNGYEHLWSSIDFWLRLIAAGISVWNNQYQYLYIYYMHANDTTLTDYKCVVRTSC